MAVDDKNRDKNYNMALTEKQQKYQHYHPEKQINTSTLQTN